MSHLIIESIDTVYTPQGIFADTWHKLQTTVKGEIFEDGSNIPEVFAPVISCGVRPELEIAENAELEQEMAKWKLLVADCRNTKAKRYIPLNIPRDGYAIHQNKVLFDAFVGAARRVLGDGNFTISTVGTLGGYSQFFISIAIKGMETFTIGKSDLWAMFFNLNSSHNSLISSNALLSAIRAVCMNTVQAAIADADDRGTRRAIKHTLNSAELITEKSFADDLALWVKNAETFKSVLNACKAQPMNMDEFRAFSAGVFTQDGSDQLSTNSWNRIKELEVAFVRGVGNSGQSRYDAVNAWTEFFTRGGVGNPVKVALNKRVASANFGRGNDWKLEAIRIASNEESFAEASARGAIFYTDKMTVENSKN